VLLASQAAYELFVGPIRTYELNGKQRRLVLRHKFDNQFCVNPDHLTLGTQAENVWDCCSKNRQARGTKIGNSKLSEHHVRKIRQLWEKNKDKPYKYRYRIGELAEAFGVSYWTIGQIIHNETWVGV
jgi:hypothetical protein